MTYKCQVCAKILRNTHANLSDRAMMGRAQHSTKVPYLLTILTDRQYNSYMQVFHGRKQEAASSKASLTSATRAISAMKNLSLPNLKHTLDARLSASADKIEDLNTTFGSRSAGNLVFSFLVHSTAGALGIPLGLACMVAPIALSALNVALPVSTNLAIYSLFLVIGGAWARMGINDISRATRDLTDIRKLSTSTMAEINQQRAMAEATQVAKITKTKLFKEVIESALLVAAGGGIITSLVGFCAGGRFPPITNNLGQPVGPLAQSIAVSALGTAFGLFGIGLIFFGTREARRSLLILKALSKLPTTSID